ncbi:LuxR C-terminal-related transcriptional regulator [Kribbella sindirgiensis]|uniref:Helix-turn-helix transcriptional regulator n=1 Tax=Kribbella sindirgiensis TaxID=1124744 RepID=A0A4R0I437_9ACTN|nr:LuxR C-terminal-related transcriptional regulator [Kribbella sindirgiensis]TCC22381.1 helix-turn-helix transcriptional regulator [Kribbella sindirgiensis]
MPTTVLATKLFPPARRSGLVGRPRLTARLDSTLEPGHRLALVSAPAGFGKTTLVAEWAAGHERVGWLSLDDGDNALPRFLAHLWAALPGIRVAPPAADVPTTAALTALVNDYAAQADLQSVLVLDDYHVIEALDVHEAVAFLLDHLPDQLHLVVATRADPPFPLARLRGRGQLTEIRVDDLRFAGAEAGAFLNDVMGLRLTENDVRALEGRTEGWVAGLQLAALSLRGVSDISGFLQAFTGSHRFVIDYLAAEVLARQRPEIRDFLLRTAVLERLTGPLCDAVSGTADSARILDELDRGNVFLVALDADRTWYRYHHLFRDVLRARLLAERPEELPALHRAAGEWYAAERMAPDAVRHALAAGDQERAAFLIEEALPEVRRTRQDSLLLSWIRSLPESVARRRPVLCIARAWSSMMAGELDHMARWLDDAEAALTAGPAVDGAWADTEDLRTAPALVLVYRAALAQARGEVAATVRCAERALELAGADDHFIRGAAGGFVALATWAAGDVEEALTTFATAVRSLRAAGNLTDVHDSTVVMGDLWMAAGRPSQARKTFEQALAAATRNGEPYPRVTADLHVGLAELDRELNDLAGAEAHLETSRILAEHGSITENRHRRHVAMAQVQVARGDCAAALALLDGAEDLYRRGSYPELKPIAALRARVYLAAGDLVAAGAWATGISDTVSYLHEYEQLTLARLLIHRGDDVLGLLDRLRGDASRRAGSRLEIDVLRALALHQRGERSDALAALRQALAAAPEPDRYVRLFLDEGAPMLALLQDAAPDEPLVRRLLKAPTALPDPLTERELEVLRLLDTELTGPEIARRLYVSLNTLRTHTKRIFAKLGATNRSGAVRRARERGLL